MSNRQKAIEAMAQYLISTDERSARKTCAQLATIYEQKVMLRPDTATLKVGEDFTKVSRWTTEWEVAE